MSPCRTSQQAAHGLGLFHQVLDLVVFVDDDEPLVLLDYVLDLVCLMTGRDGKTIPLPTNALVLSESHQQTILASAGLPALAQEFELLPGGGPLGALVELGDLVVHRAHEALVPSLSLESFLHAPDRTRVGVAVPWARGFACSRHRSRFTCRPRGSCRRAERRCAAERLGWVKMQRRPFSRPELMFLVGVPLAWAILLLFHPGGEGKELYRDLQDQVTRMLVVHIGMLLFIPLMAVVVYVLLRGVDGTAALISRIALAVYVVFYGAWEAMYGIGLGVLGAAVNGLPETQRATGAAVIQEYGEHVLLRGFGVLVSIGSVAFVTATIAAGIALRRHAGAPLAVPILLGLSGVLITAHPPPFGPTGLALFIAAVLLFARSQSGARASDPVGQPRYA